MTTRPRAVSLVLAALILGAPAAPARAATATPVVLGTTQLDGYAASLGQTFTLGKQSPLNFTLLRAEYSVGRVVIGSSVVYPKLGEKLLVLHFTVHNPQKSDVRYYWPDFTFTAVDAQDRNYRYVQKVARDGTPESLEVRLKPAQKINVMTVISVPAQGTVPKLLVQRGSENAVLRYDLRGRVQGLTGGAADPADPSGATALAAVPSPLKAYRPLERFDVRLDEATYSKDPLNGEVPAAGQRYLRAIFTIRNMEPGGGSYAWSDFKPSVKDADGETVPYNSVMLKASRDEKASGRLTAGEEARVRFSFALPDGVTAKTLSLTDSAGRAYVYDLSSVKE